MNNTWEKVLIATEESSVDGCVSKLCPLAAGKRNERRTKRKKRVKMKMKKKTTKKKEEKKKMKKWKEARPAIALSRSLKLFQTICRIVACIYVCIHVCVYTSEKGSELSAFVTKAPRDPVRHCGSLEKSRSPTDSRRRA